MYSVKYSMDALITMLKSHAVIIIKGRATSLRSGLINEFRIQKINHIIRKALIHHSIVRYSGM